MLVTAISPYELVSEGMHGAVIADVEDLGMVDTDFGKKHKAMIVYFTDEDDSTGKQKRMFQRFTVSLNAKATFVKILGQLGVKIEANKDVDTEALIGKQVQLLVSHSDGQGASAGKRYANITAITKPTLGQRVEAPADFVRKQDRTNQ